MKAHKLPKLSVEEYLKHESENDTKYEYHNGEIFALAGGSINHGTMAYYAQTFTLKSEMSYEVRNLIVSLSQVK